MTLCGFHFVNRYLLSEYFMQSTVLRSWKDHRINNKNYNLVAGNLAVS